MISLAGHVHQDLNSKYSHQWEYIRLFLKLVRIIQARCSRFRRNVTRLTCQAPHCITMGQLLAFTFILISTWSFGQPDFSKIPKATDSTYGYTDTNPLKMKKGNPGRSIGYAYDFLSGLATPDDKDLKFVQRYAVENPKNKKVKSELNHRQLDKYIFVTHQKKDTLTIYVDIYRK